MKQTSKVIGIDLISNETTVYSSKGVLAERLGLSRETVVNWFRDDGKYIRDNVMYYKVHRYISREKS